MSTEQNCSKVLSTPLVYFFFLTLTTYPLKKTRDGYDVMGVKVIS
jgi:hypothetical protein